MEQGTYEEVVKIGRRDSLGPTVFREVIVNCAAMVEEGYGCGWDYHTRGCACQELYLT